MIQTVERDKWKIYATNFHDYNYHQLWEYGIACAQRIKGFSEHIAVQTGNDIIGLADVRIKKIPLTRTGVAYINGGPLIRQNDDSDAQRLEICLHELIREYVENRKLELRIKAPLGPPEWMSKQTETFKENGFQIYKKIRSYRTFLVNLNQPIDNLRKKLAKKWRSHLKKAEAAGFEVRQDRSEDSFQSFTDLYKTFMQKKGFDVDLDPAFYLNVHKKLNKQERFRISLIHQENVLIAGHVSSILGDTAVNLFRANHEIALKNRASYLLQWDGICAAQAQGCKWYDLGGIDPVNNPGVYSFKKGLGGDDVTAPGPFNIYPNTISKNTIVWSEKLYNIYKKIKH